jgi:hypothetical protein
LEEEKNAYLNFSLLASYKERKTAECRHISLFCPLAYPECSLGKLGLERFLTNFFMEAGGLTSCKFMSVGEDHLLVLSVSPSLPQ